MSVLIVVVLSSIFLLGIYWGFRKSQPKLCSSWVRLDHLVKEVVCPVRFKKEQGVTWFVVQDLCEELNIQAPSYRALSLGSSPIRWIQSQYACISSIHAQEFLLRYASGDVNAARLLSVLRSEMLNRS